MPTVSDIPSGAPCWIDLFTSDPDRSTAFYGELFGWTAEAAPEEFGGYLNFSKGADRVAGGMRNDGSSGTPDGWNVYLSVPDAEKTLETATAEGAQVIVPAMAVGDLGVMGVLIDPGGAAIGIWQPGEHTGFTLLGEPGAPGWFELHSREYDTALPFYRSVFGWDTTTMGDDPGFRYTTLGKDEDARAGVMDAAAFLPEGVPSSWAVYFTTASTDDSIAAAVKLGATVVQPAEDTPYGRMAGLTDPTGAYFKLNQP